MQQRKPPRLMGIDPSTPVAYLLKGINRGLRPIAKRSSSSSSTSNDWPLAQQDRVNKAQQDKLRADYQRQVDQLGTQIAQLQRSLADSQLQLNQQQLTASQVEKETIKLRVTHEISEIDHAQRIEQLEQELATTRQSEQLWRTECAQLKKDQQSQQQAQKTAQLVDTFSQLLTKNPIIGQTLEQGLGRLWGPKPSKPLVSEPSVATKLGEAIVHDFPGAELRAISDLLQYLRDTPQEKDKLLAQPGFVAYRTNLWTAQQQRAQKKQPKQQ